MGEVKETVKGSGPKKGNLQQQVASLMDEVSECIIMKDDDVDIEGDAEKAENMRKATLLRAVHNLLSCSRHLLEEY